MKYHVIYNVEPHPEGLEKDQVPEGMGAASAIIIGSILFPPDGSYSIAFITGDGRTGENLSDLELFKAWLLLANQLSLSDTLGPSSRELCKLAFTTCQTVLMATRRDDERAEVKPKAEKPS